MIRTEDTELLGLKRVFTKHLADSRGFFTKTMHEDMFRSAGLRFDFKEEYYSVSKKNVLRGLHFQTPPFDHAKYVTCIHGRILDVVIDLRAGSQTFAKAAGFELSDDVGMSVYVPTGFAHGFLALTEGATVLYRVTATHAPANDTGLLWSSIDFKWPIASPIISDRDAAFEKIQDFESPFKFGESK